MRHPAAWPGLTLGFALFALAACDESDPTTGVIAVSAVTQGAELDPDGYGVLVQGVNDDSPAPLDVNGAVSVGVPAGTYAVELADVASNCTVEGGPTRTVSVSAGETTQATYSVTCTATVGTVQVVTASSGAPLDADGYLVAVGADTMTAEVNDTVLFTDLEPNDYDVTLLDVASECSVTEDNPQLAPVVAGDTAEVAFTLECSVPSGIVYVSDPGTGSDLHILDPVTGISTQITFDGVGKQYPRWSPDRTRIVFARSDGTSDHKLYLINPDGTGLTQLTTSPGFHWSPTWSPDGTKVVWANFGDGEMYVINVDGTGETKLTQLPPNSDWPDWSPDGSRIVYNRGNDLYTMAPDGTDLTSLGLSGTWAKWSPDGTRIAFTAEGTGGVSWVWIANADGSGASEVVASLVFHIGGWSPDGNWILFTSSGMTSQLYRVRPDGTDLTQLTSGGLMNAWGDWR